MACEGDAGGLRLNTRASRSAQGLRRRCVSCAPCTRRSSIGWTSAERLEDRLDKVEGGARANVVGRRCGPWRLGRMAANIGRHRELLEFGTRLLHLHLDRVAGTFAPMRHVGDPQDPHMSEHHVAKCGCSAASGRQARERWSSWVDRVGRDTLDRQPYSGAPSTIARAVYAHV